MNESYRILARVAGTLTYQTRKGWSHRAVMTALLSVALLPTSALKQTSADSTARAFNVAVQSVGWQFPVMPYAPGSYANRTFFCCPGGALGRHLGEDVALAEGTPIRAAGPGVIKVYGSATGYGELVVVIEHDLGQPHNFTNAYGDTVNTRYILSIYGHLRASQTRGGQTTGLTENQRVEAGTVIGYVNDDAHNGDGAEHLHLGIRLSDAATAQARDQSWFRGYERATDFGKDYAPASAVIQTLTSRCGGSTPILFAEEGTERAIVLDSVTMLRDPLPVVTQNNLSVDQRTRILLFAANIEMTPGENASTVTAQAEDSQSRVYSLAVEAVELVPGYDCLTQVNLRLADELASAESIWITITLRGQTSNRVLVRIRT